MSQEMKIRATSSTKISIHPPSPTSSSSAKKYVLDLVSDQVQDQTDGKRADSYAPRISYGHKSVIPGLTYCVVSTTMVLLNKAILSSYNFNAPIAMLLIQCSFCAIIAFLSHAVGLTKLESPSARLISLMIPINIVFVGMIATSFLALQDLGVAMVTVLKNITNLFIICGDYLLFGKVYNRYVWCTLALMVVSAICGSITDIAFSWQGYIWQLVNCAMTASYSLSLRLLMERYISKTPGIKKLNEMSMVFYNNFLSVPLLLPLALSRGELSSTIFQGVGSNPHFIVAASLSAIFSLAISFCSLWFLSTTTATTYSFVGSLNKVPLACIAVILSQIPVSLENGLSILTGLLASIVFVWAKQKT